MRRNFASVRKLRRQDRDIVVRPLACPPIGDLAKQRGEPLSERYAPSARDRVQEPGVAERFAAGRHRVGESAGIQVQSVARS